MQKYHYFVAHEFSRQEKDDLREAIEEAFEGTGLNAYYADLEVRSSGTQKYILEKIRDMIFRTQFGIYDITNTKKPNVFLELGLAMAAEKPLYIICKKGTKIPADLQGLDRIEYESYKKLTKLIRTRIVKNEIERLSEIKLREKLIQESKQKYGELPEEEILKKCVKLYQAEELHHGFGDEVEDKKASNQRAWFADLSETQSHFIYGPYEELPEPGTYIALFKMKIDDNTPTESFLQLGTYGAVISTRTVRKNEFYQPYTYQFFGLEFKYQGGLMEYRARNIKLRGKIWLDYVAIVKLA